MFQNLQSFRLPAEVAETQEDFVRNFYNLRKNDWDNVLGIPWLHIASYHLGKMLMLNKGKPSGEYEELKIKLAHFIKDTFECSIDRAYAILHRIYIPTEEEYEYLMKREYSGTPCTTPIVVGVYDSVDEESQGWFNFCLDKWNGWHDLHQDIDETDREVRKQLKGFRQSIADEWSAMTEEQHNVWAQMKRGE